MNGALKQDAAQLGSPEVQQHHVPAWKRLGLKLKFARDTHDSPTKQNGVVLSPAKRPLNQEKQPTSDEAENIDPPTKKRRIDSSPPTTSPLNADGIKFPTPSLRKTSNGMRKSVKFTPETKVEDGDSSKTLIAAWELENDSLESQYKDQIREHEEKTAQTDAFLSSPPLATKPQKAKREKHRQKENQPDTTTRKSNIALDYLTRYHKSKESWKFNKSREIWIFKHVLSTKDIPSSYNVALASYLHGLRSEAAKARLIAQCREDLAQNGENHSSEAGEQQQTDSTTKLAFNMEDPKRREAYHQDAVRRFKRSLEAHVDKEQEADESADPEYQQWLARRKRAELLLWSLIPQSSSDTQSMDSGTTILPVSSTSPSSAGNSTSGAPKKRKNRTAVVDISSSSEDESDSSDESGSEAETRSEATRSPKSAETITSGSQSDSSSDVSSTSSSSEEDEDPQMRPGFRGRHPSIISISSDSSRPVSAISISSSAGTLSQDSDPTSDQTSSDENSSSSSESGSNDEDSSGNNSD